MTLTREVKYSFFFLRRFTAPAVVIQWNVKYIGILSDKPLTRKNRNCSMNSPLILKQK